MPDGDIWTSCPGLVELVEQGATLDDLRHSDIAKPAAVRSTAGADMLESLVSWIKGFRRERLVFERRPAWLPLAELWPARDGTATFQYTTSATEEGNAELSVFASTLGNSSKTVLGQSIQTPASDEPFQFCVEVLLTCWRYRHKENSNSFDRIDVDCSGAMRTTDTRRTESGFAERELALDLPALLARGYELVDGPHRIDDLGGRMGSRSIEGEQTNEWGYELALPGLDLLKTNIKLAAKSARSRSFKAVFELPSGHEYVFVRRRGERPIVPLCYALP